MIGSVSSASFASFGYSHHPQGDRFASPGQRDADKFANDTPQTARTKEEQEKAKNPNHLDEDEKQQVEKLKRRDAEVRAHEQAHMAAAGSLAMGGPTYVYQTGPDGKQYAIGGNVKIDTSPGRTPEETAEKAKQIRAAALAPSEPSAQDIKVAASAASMEMEAAAKLSGKDAEKSTPTSPETGNSTGEITSARQVFASSQNESHGEGDRRQQNAYLQKAAHLYQNQQR